MGRRRRPPGGGEPDPPRVSHGGLQEALRGLQEALRIALEGPEGRVVLGGWGGSPSPWAPG